MIEVAAAFLIHAEKVLIARRKSPPRLAGKWEFPGGKVEKGETLQVCLAREIEEEFRIKIDVGAFGAASIHRQGEKSFHIQAYYATWLAGQIKPVAHDRCTWAGPDDLLDYDLLPADIELAKSLIESGF